MALEILMPQLGLTMTEGTITEWAKKPGDTVAKGDVLFYVENDKAVIPYEAAQSGVLVRILVAPMQTVPVGTVVALLETADSKGVTVPTSAASSATSQSEHAAVPSPAPEQVKKPPQPQPAAPPPAVSNAVSPGHSQIADSVLASPYARRLAEQSGIKLGDLKGSGPFGAIVASDVRAASQQASPEAMVSATAASATVRRPAPEAARPEAPASGEGTIINLSKPRQVAAERLAQSWHDIPQFTLAIEVEAQGLLDALEAFRGDGLKVSMTALIAKLTAQALMAFPMLNSTWLGDGKVLVHPHADLAIAVDSPDGLMVPVLRACEQKQLTALAVELASLAEGARNRTLPPDAMQGGTFTISNLGMFGITRFRA
ncbi:MAG: dihydrolipoamide acetyltransferase family protein, partial [Spirochaetales bacterium]|nr:dihydrolipoamide acetyltransferase family protein [Spirochaetales bacterium]